MKSLQIVTVGRRTGCYAIRDVVGCNVACWFGPLLLDFSHKFLSRERAVPRMCRLSGRCMVVYTRRSASKDIKGSKREFRSRFFRVG